MQALVAHIKEKRELKGIADAVVHSELHVVLRKEHLKSIPTNPKSKQYKIIVKAVRANLRRISGLFAAQSLAKHPSTRGRDYLQLYKEIFTVTGTPRSIIDIGCGINPLSYEFLGCRPVYFAYDIDEEALAVVKSFFTQHSIKGSTAVLDARSPEFLPKADVAFVWKLADILDTQGHKKIESLCVGLEVSWIVLGFSTLTMSNKPMTAPDRPWVKLMAARLVWQLHELRHRDDLFYILKK